MPQIAAGTTTPWARARPRAGPLPRGASSRAWDLSWPASVPVLQPAQHGRLAHAADGEDVRGRPQRDVLATRERHDLRARILHGALELAVHALLVPRELLVVLHPLEVAHGHAA